MTRPTSDLEAPGMAEALAADQEKLEALTQAPKPKERPRLDFRNPTFHRGLNVTVRRGPKWHWLLRPELAAGSRAVKVRLARTGGEVICLARVVAVECGRLSQLPEALLESEHDPACRTREGLLEELRRVYGDPDVRPDEVVSAVVFYPLVPRVVRSSVG